MIEAIHSPNAAAAQATALEMLGGLSCGADHPSSTSEAAAVKQAYADRAATTSPVRCIRRHRCRRRHLSAGKTRPCARIRGVDRR